MKNFTFSLYGDVIEVIVFLIAEICFSLEGFYLKMLYFWGLFFSLVQ